MVQFNTEQLTQRWEDQRAIKNLMGKYANCIMLNREQDVFPLFWSCADDVCLSFNDGGYVGSEAVKGYYDACYQRNKLVAELMQKRFPKQLGHLSEEERYGIGPFKVRPLYTPVIEVAADGKTAKGLWYCLGAYNDVEACGPLAHWTWGYFAVDFIREDDGWKIWHLSYTNDVDCICGQSWGKSAEYPAALPEFAPLADFAYPPYTVEKNLREHYHPQRPHTDAPPIPQPYDTFADTFSYGI